MGEFLKDATLCLSDGSKVKAEDYLEDKIVALYFSAMWCPPCRMFTPKLKVFYDELKSAEKKFEIIFVSRDKKEEYLLEYYNDHHGPWTYLQFGDPLVDKLIEKYEVKTIPSLKIIRKDGSLIVDGRSEVGNEEPLVLFEKWLSQY